VAALIGRTTGSGSAVLEHEDELNQSIAVSVGGAVVHNPREFQRIRNLAMARSRSAQHTLNGYHYQFDKSILEILRAPRGETVTLEGIEDIDVGDEAIQCKYHASKKYTPSAIKKPLLAFLTHYATSNTPLRYTLYAHFQDHSSFTPINLAKLKAIVKDDIKPLKLSDGDLTVFLSRHFCYEQAADIDAQREEVHQELQSAVGCDRHESELHFYHNALHEVIRLSRHSTLGDGTTNRDTFLGAINHKRTLFSLWLCQLRGQKTYLAFVREQLKTRRAMASTKARFIHVDNRLVRQSGVAGLYRFCDVMIEAHFKVGKSLKDAVPIVVIVDASDEELTGVKRALLEKQRAINDGYENVAFQPWFFNAAPIINVKTTARTNRPTDTIAKSSYELQLIGQKTYLSHSQDIDLPDTLILTSKVADAPIESSPHTDVFHFVDVARLDDLATALT